MKSEDITVTIRAIDEVTPVLRRIRRQLWWSQYGGLVLSLLATVAVIFSFLAGRVTA